MSKIKEEQLKELQDQVNSINQNQLKIGNLESQKHTLIHNGVELQNQLRTIQNTLEEEYGKVTINISTGEYQEVSEEVEDEDDSELDEAKAELEEAMTTIKSLKSTINEVNLLNAKLLYTNKLFRSYDLNNDQKMKVVETLDRTKNVREVKLVFSTLAESLKIGGTSRKTKQTAKLTESFASKVVASTAPSKEVITESTNTMADRFKQLANIK